MTSQRGLVAVIGEWQGESLAPITRELLAAARPLADGLGAPCAAILIGDAPDSACREAIASGADRIYRVSHEFLKSYQPELWLSAAEQACAGLAPSVVLLGRTEMGRDLGPRLAYRLKTGLMQDCLKLSLDAASGRVTGERPVYGGNAVARVACAGSPQMASIRPKAYSPLAADASRTGTVEQVQVALEASLAKTIIVGTVVEPAAGVKLEDAKVIVAGGRGIGGAEGFKRLEELATLLGGAVGASRPAVDANWVSALAQIGLTGKSVSPELYITVGISGASQHLAGCSGARTIVAINKDAGANIFREAKLGVVGDWREVLPSLTQAVRELLENRKRGDQ